MQKNIYTQSNVLINITISIFTNIKCEKCIRNPDTINL